MANVVDVAAYVLGMTGDVTTMKLQKLVYYCQAQYLVMNHIPMFEEEIQAWANGPVVPVLFDKHRGMFMIGACHLPNAGQPLDLSQAERNSIKKVVDTLGRYSGEQLIALTHSEDPWRDARKGLKPGQRSENPITTESMLQFYSSPACKNPVFA